MGLLDFLQEGFAPKSLAKKVSVGIAKNPSVAAGISRAIDPKSPAARKAIREKNGKASAPKKMTPRQELPKYDLVIDPSTMKEAGKDYYDRMAEEESDPMQELLDALEQGYQGTMPGYDDTEAIAALDAALGNTLTGIQGIRDTTNANYKTSDANLESMHNAHKNDIQTNGAAAYNSISDTLVNSIGQGRDETVNEMTAIEDESRNKRAAMLQSLGIQEAAAAPESEVMQDAKANIVSRSATDNSFAEGQRATNQSYNQGLAQSVASAGTERRNALQQQLLKANSTIDAQEMDARTQYQNQRANLAGQKASQQNTNAQFEYGMYQDDQNGMREILDSLSAGSDEEPAKTNGYAGLAQDLVNSGIDQQTASQAMQTHAELIGSEEYLKARQKGSDSTSWVIGQMTKKGIPVAVAMQLVTNYNNLGSTSGYAAMQ